MILEGILRAHIWLFATVVPLLVRFLPLGALLTIVTPIRWWRPYRAFSPERILELVRRRLASPRVMKRRACLREGLTLFHFLRLAGQPAFLQIGVYPMDPAGGQGHAHCWILLHGQIFASPPSREAAVVLTHPRETSEKA
jgi:hypothetical protein